MLVLAQVGRPGRPAFQARSSLIAKMQKLQIDRSQPHGGGGGLLRLQMYQLHYWPTFTGRVEPILMLLSDAGAGALPEHQTLSV